MCSSDLLLHHGLNAYPPFTQRKQWQEMGQTLQSYAEIISQECLTLSTQKRGLHRLSSAHKKATNTVAQVLQGGMKVKKAKGAQHRQYDGVVRLTLAQKRDFASSAE